MADREVADLLGPLGTLLAAFAFFYQSAKPAIDRARLRPHEIETEALTVVDLHQRLPAVRSARNVSVLLALAATVVASAFLPPLLDLAADAHYSPVKAAFSLLEVFWLGVAAGTWVLAWRLWRDARRVEQERTAQERALAAAEADRSG